MDGKQGWSPEEEACALSSRRGGLGGSHVPLQTPYGSGSPGLTSATFCSLHAFPSEIILGEMYDFDNKAYICETF